MHDGEDAGAVEVVPLDLPGFLEQPAHPAIGRVEGGRRPGRDQRMDPAVREHPRQGPVRRGEAQPDAGGLHRLEREAPRVFQPSLDPFDVLGTDAVVVREGSASPHGRGHLVFGYADALTLEVLRRVDAGAAVNEDAGLPEEPRREHGNRHQVVGPASPAHHVASQRGLGHVELAILHHAPERFLHLQRQAVEPDAVGLYTSVPQGPRYGRSGRTPVSGSA